MRSSWHICVLTQCEHGECGRQASLSSCIDTRHVLLPLCIPYLCGPPLKFSVMRRAHRLLPFVTQCRAAFLQPPCSLQHGSQQLFAPVSAAGNTALAGHSPGWQLCAGTASFASDAATVTLDGSQSTLDSINDRFSEAREEIDLGAPESITSSLRVMRRIHSVSWGNRCNECVLLSWSTTGPHRIHLMSPFISAAKDDAETTYFNESHAEAKKAVDSALDMYSHLLEQLSPDDAAKLQRSMGLKVCQSHWMLFHNQGNDCC